MKPTRIGVKHVQPSRVNIVLHLLLLGVVVFLAAPDELFTPTGKVTDAGIVATVQIIGSNSPFFVENLTDRSINQTKQLFVDANCSDLDLGDEITYVDNITFLDINETTGIIDKTGFNDSLVGNHTVQITCNDLFGESTNQTFNLEIINERSAPILGAIGNQLAIEGDEFFLRLTATDAENDPLIFGDNVSFFVLNVTSGVINFTPTIDLIGNHTINFTVTDGDQFDHEVILLTIVRGPFCGDLICSSDESCDSCEIDCGVCPTGPGASGGNPEGGGSSGSGGSGSSSTSSGGGVVVQSSQPPQRCDENWECTPWTICSLDGRQTRTCKDTSGCGTTEKKPEEQQECEYEPTCYDGIRNGGEVGIDCGGPCDACIIATCFDGIQNQGELGIDCGGPCVACAEKELETLPTLEVPGLIDLPRKFPWLLPLIIFIILLLILLGDYLYLRHIKKKELNVYKQKMIAYAPWRRRMYKAIYNLLGITFVTTLYLYYYSNDFEAMKENIWKLIVLICITPIIISYLLRKYRFYEHEKEKKEHHFKKTHRKGILTLLRLENSYLHDLELYTKKDIFGHTTKRDYDPFPVVYGIVRKVYGLITTIVQKRKERLEQLKMDSHLVAQMQKLLQDPILTSYAKTYAEFDAVRRIMVYLVEHKDADNTDREQDLLDEIEGLTQPHMKSVILADKQLIMSYNTLVDLYEIEKARKDQLKDLDLSLFSLERNFNDEVKGLTKKSKEIEKIQKNHTLAVTYNHFIRLFNHYTKKQQLKKALENS